MRTSPLLFSILAATLMSAGVVSAQAADGKFYDPSNAASPTGKTIGYELNRTIGCPGRGLMDTPCKVPPEADSDGDGVVDSKDKCPDTPKGTEVDADGCPIPVAAAATPAPVAELAPESPVVAPVPAPAPHRLVLEGVNFEFDRATLRPEDGDVIDKDMATLKEWGDVKVEVAGHTDSVGSDRYNMDLSLRRANTVRNYLISKGIAADRLVAKGYGESQPIASNDTDEGRFKNRRVELNQIKE
ncbi:OmpA family protein [Thiobacillus sp.]